MISRPNLKLTISNSTHLTNGLLLLLTMVFLSGIYKMNPKNRSELSNITLLKTLPLVKMELSRMRNVLLLNGILKVLDSLLVSLMVLSEFGMSLNLLDQLNDHGMMSCIWIFYIFQFQSNKIIINNKIWKNNWFIQH